MLVTRIKLKNWRNFRALDVPLRDVSYLLGPNASGKSNLLDAFRFLRDVSKSKGGGLQTAVADRGGISKLRRSEEHTSELQSLMRISYAVFCLKKKKTQYLIII